MKTCAIIWMRFGPYHLARLREASKSLAAEGYRVIGLEIAGTDSIYEWDVETTQKEPFVRRTIFPETDYNILQASDIAGALKAELTQTDPDCVAINGWGVPEARAALSWCKRNGRAAILMSETFPEGSVRKTGKLKELAKSWLVRKYDAALVGGAPHKDYVASLGLPRERIFVGYDVVDNDYFRKGAEEARANEEKLRQKYGLPEQYFYANTRFLERKNLDGLLRSYALYRERTHEKPWDLVLSGSGSIESRLRTLAAELKLENVLWTGFLQYPVLPVYYGLASCFVHSAKAEAWGLVVNEAVASGLPVLSSLKVGAAHELVEDGVNGYLFDPFSVDSMAAALERITALSRVDRAAMESASARIAAEWGAGRFGEGLMSALKAACFVETEGAVR